MERLDRHEEILKLPQGTTKNTAKEKRKGKSKKKH
tara:strand:+ start:743 stop:847 length:105 start_codon:yes stop_codon:yes gene_type:complete